MCYPSGVYNDQTLQLLAERNCRLAFTTDLGLAMLEPNSVLRLRRLDTNDLPKDSSSPPNHWTQAIMPQ